MSAQADVTTTREEAAQVGEYIYEQHLQSILEPVHIGRVVAIYIPTQDYFIGDSLLEATDHLRLRYPTAGRGEVYTRAVGARAVIHAHTPRVVREQK